MDFTKLYAQRVCHMRASEIRELLKYAQEPDFISFGGGMPSPNSFPVKPIKKFAVKVLKEHGPQALQYGATEGLASLREILIERMKRYDIACNMDEIIITSGLQQALDLTGKIFLDPGDVVVVELPTFLGAITSWNCYQPEYLPVSMDNQGMRTHELEQKLKEAKAQGKKVKFIYTIPTFQNPLGVTMSLERRKHLLEIAEKFEIPVIEDDPYRELRYSGKDVPTIKSMDKTGSVIYFNTFSKILSPGFRLAWVIGNSDVIRKMVIAKQGADLSSNIFVQYIANEYMRSGMVDKQVKKIRRMYKRKRNIMLRALTKHFPKEAKWTRPEGGMFLWVTLPVSLKDTVDMYEEIKREKIIYVYGVAFCVDGSGHNTMRLNFSNTDDDKIEEGVRRLANIVKRRLG
jgi:2-aminoadipate transaminase